MTALDFLVRIVVGLLAFAGLVLLFAAFQHFLDTDLDDSPPEPPHGDSPHVPDEARR